VRLGRIESQHHRGPVGGLALRGVQRELLRATLGELGLVAPGIPGQGRGRLLQRRRGPLLEQVRVGVAGVPLGDRAGELAQDLAGRQRLHEVAPVHLHAGDLPVETHEDVELRRRHADAAPELRQRVDGVPRPPESPPERQRRRRVHRVGLGRRTVAVEVRFLCVDARCHGQDERDRDP
jgi:hypothetical protein